MSSDNIKKNLYGKLFLLILYTNLLRWLLNVKYRIKPSSYGLSFSRMESDYAQINPELDWENVKIFKQSLIECIIEYEKPNTTNIDKFKLEWQNDYNIENIINKKFEIYDREYNINLEPTIDIDEDLIHIEFRGHSGTTNYEEIKIYVQYLQDLWMYNQKLTNNELLLYGVQNKEYDFVKNLLSNYKSYLDMNNINIILDYVYKLGPSSKIYELFINQTT